MDEHCTVYFSKSAWLFSETDLSALLQQSRLNNAVTGISGVLLYVRGSIVQVLEGEAQVVETLFNRIQTDRRHTDVTRVIDRLITKRLFADWTMGYETTTSQQMADIKSVANFDEQHQDTTLKAQQAPILRMIKAFYEGNHYN